MSATKNFSIYLDELGSTWTSLRGKLFLTAWLCGSSGFGLLGAILGATLFSVLDTGGIKGTADYVITNTGQILDPTASNENNRVLLQIVADAGDVSGDFDTVSQPYPGDFTQG